MLTRVVTFSSPLPAMRPEQVPESLWTYPDSCAEFQAHLRESFDQGGIIK